MPQIRKQLEDVRKLVAEASNEGKEKAKAIEAELVAMLDDHKHRLLEMGTPGRLLIAGEFEDVLPLEDADALEQAKPVTPSGQMKKRSAEDRGPSQCASSNDHEGRAGRRCHSRRGA
ncbi:MAG TPA: hypothetical protein VKS79_11230 [Gemmataceae bacterium]|nr:hypothetical protein [Gemmataceae bacterium]